MIDRSYQLDMVFHCEYLQLPPERRDVLLQRILRARTHKDLSELKNMELWYNYYEWRQKYEWWLRNRQDGQSFGEMLQNQRLWSGPPRFRIWPPERHDVASNVLTIADHLENGSKVADFWSFLVDF